MFYDSYLDAPEQAPVVWMAPAYWWAWSTGYYDRPKMIKRGAYKLYYHMTEAVTQRRFIEAMGLQRDFLSIYRMLSIHTWMVVARVRNEGYEGKDLAQALYRAFSDDLSIRTDAHPDLRYRHGKYVKELEMMWYGSSMAYDNALVGEEDLADALLRNVYLGNKQKKKDAKNLERYVRRELACLAVTEVELIKRGDVRFTNYFNDEDPDFLQRRSTMPQYYKDIAKQAMEEEAALEAAAREVEVAAAAVPKELEVEASDGQGQQGKIARVSQ